MVLNLHSTYKNVDSVEFAFETNRSMEEIRVQNQILNTRLTFFFFSFLNQGTKAVNVDGCMGLFLINVTAEISIYIF